jgi:hypothetical protein
MAILSLNQHALPKHVVLGTAKTQVKPQALDEVTLDGCKFFLSKRGTSWAVRRDDVWVDLTSYTLVPKGIKKWEAQPSMSKQAPNVKPPTVFNFIVSVSLNKETHHFSFKAYSEEQAKRKALGELSRKTGRSIPFIRNCLLPNAWAITKELT